MKILIVDDEELARARLGRMISALHPEAQQLEASNGKQALECVAEQAVDIVMLDIGMPVMGGIEAAQHLCRLQQAPWIIFTTAWQQHALAAFDCHAVAYLLKPVRRQALQEALQRATALDQARLAALQHTLGAPRRFLSLRTGLRLDVVPIEEILYLRAEQKYVLIGLAEGERVVDESLRVLEREFSERFLRVHRNALVATHHIKGLEKDPKGGGWSVLFRASDMRLPVSRRLLTKVKNHLQSFRS